MEYGQALKLIQHESFIRYANANYRFAGLYPEGHLLRKTHLMIFDEPPSLHVDSIKIESSQFTQPAGVAPPVSNEAIETVHEKSLRLIREFLKNEPQEVKRIIKEVEDMEFEGPTVEEYFNSVGYEDSRTHEVKGYSREQVDAIKDVLIKSKGALEYAAFNYDGSKLENLRPGLLDSTGVSDSCLISVREINHLLSSLPTPSTDEWVDVRERLPDDGEKVYFNSHTYGNVSIGFFYKIDSFNRENMFISTDGAHFPLNDVSHWMLRHIPTPPQQ